MQNAQGAPDFLLFSGHRTWWPQAVVSLWLWLPCLQGQTFGCVCACSQSRGLRGLAGLLGWGVSLSPPVFVYSLKLPY